MSKTYEELKQPPEWSDKGTGEAPAAVMSDSDKATMEAAVIEALKTVYDPEIPVNIYDLGLIYRVVVNDGGKVRVDMTLTAPGCPVAQTFPGTVETEILKVDGVNEAHVEIVWDPPWTTDRMSEAAKLQLNML